MWQNPSPRPPRASLCLVSRNEPAQPPAEPGSTGRLCPGKPLPDPANAALQSVRSAPLFFGLTGHACTELANSARERFVVRGETLFSEDDEVESVLVIASGRVKTSQVSTCGKEVILRVEAAGDVLDAAGLFLGQSHSLSAQVLAAGILLSWDVKVFDSFIRRYPEVSGNATRILGKRLHSLQERFRDIATERVPQRLARLVLSLLETGNERFGRYSIDFSQEELAQMTGTTHFTISRVLCEWASLGLIQPERKAIVVEDLPALVAMAYSSRDSS